MTVKYLSVNFDDSAGCYPAVFDNLEDANRDAENNWERLTKEEKKHSHYYVAKITESDLDDPDDWTSFNDYESGLNFFDSDEIGRIPVEYSGGPSCERPVNGFDYMLAKYNEYGENYLLETYPSFEDVTELYAERENPTWNEDYEYFEDEDYCYEDLKEDIIEQAKENGLHPSRLSFNYDD